MEDARHFLVNLALVLCVAAASTVLCRRLRQPVVLGYLLAGAIVSPHTAFPLFADEKMVHALSELGVILLMFSLGLEFTLQKLRNVGIAAVAVAVIQCSLMVWLGHTVGRLLGWSALESLFAGAMIAISSTTIIVKAFEELNVRGAVADLVFGVLIVEDLIAILLLTLLTAVSSGEGLSAAAFASTVARLAAFLVLMLAGGLLVVPRFMRSIAVFERPETVVVTSVGLCFAMALLADTAGYSVALGAFIGGCLVAESGEGETIEHLIRPVRDVFGAIFFVSVGMMIEPRLVVADWEAIAILTVVVVLGKLAGVAIGAVATGAGIRTAVQAAMSLTQIGEFSFIIAGVGVAAGTAGESLYPIAVAVSALTTLLTPWLIRASDPLALWIDRVLPHRVRTFVGLYAGWIERLGRNRAPAEVSERRRLLRWIGIDAVLLVVLIVLFAVFDVEGSRRLAQAAGISPPAAWLVLAIATALLGGLFGTGIVRTGGALARSIARAVFPPAADGSDAAAAPRRALVVVLQLGILVAVSLPLLMLLQPFLPAHHALAPPPLLALLFLFGLWRSAATLQAEARAGVQVVVDTLSRQLHGSARAGREDAELSDVDRLAPVFGKPVPLRVGADWFCVGRSLAELNLRGMTGATVLGIVRDEGALAAPSGSEVIRAGDLLALAGTTPAIESARRSLSTGERDAPPTPTPAPPGRQSSLRA